VDGNKSPLSAGKMATPKTSGLATMSMVLGILGASCLLPIVSPILAVIFGIMGLTEIRQSGGNMTGRGEAISGIVLGILSLVAVPLLLLWTLHMKNYAPNMVCGSNLRQIGVAVAVYADEHEGRIPRKLEDLRQYLPNLDKVLICPQAKDTSHPSYQIVLGGDKWNSGESSNAIVVTESSANHHGGRNVLYGDGHVEWVSISTPDK